MATSDERREVARKIREYVDAYGDKIEDAEMVLLGTVWCRGEVGEVVRPTSEAELLAMVADLIDPTCADVHDDSYKRDADKAAYCAFKCSACGHERLMTDMVRDATLYCPHCGARVMWHRE